VGAQPPPANAGGHGLVVARSDGAEGVRVTAAGEIDVASAPILAAELCAAIESGAAVVVDLGDVTFMDSSGLNALVMAHHAAPGRISLGSVHPNVRRVLEIAGVADIFAPPGP
jgi:stage II sporulation protein AA (anti-sigma F factor antagonist)